MALSQKHFGKVLVPWYTCNEWKHVYDLIYHANSPGCRHEALQMLKTWKSRMPLLSSGVEGTLVVLEALTTDITNFPEHVIKSLYGTALMRFLNLCAANSDKQGTFYSSAKRNNIPDWIIDLRHDFAHAHDLPPLPLLTISLNFALSWLKKEYWSVHYNDIKDYIITEQIEESQKNINRLFSILCELNKKTFNNEKIELAVYGEDIVNESQDKPKMKQLILSLLGKIKDDNCTINKELLVNILIEKGDMLNVMYLQEKDNNKCLQKGLVAIWENVLKYFIEKGMMSTFLKKIYEGLSNWCYGEKTKMIAYLWIIEVLGLLKKQKMILDKNMKEDTPKTSFKCNVTCSEIDKDIENFKELVLNEPNKYALDFLKPLLLLCNCTEDYISFAESLIKSYTIVENSKNDTPMDMDTCQNLIKQVETKLGVDNEEMECQPLPNNISESNKRWTKCTDTSKYLGPLGIIVAK